MGMYFKQGRIMEDLSTHPDTAEAEGNYAYRAGYRADDNPYPEGEMRERFNKGFWDARNNEMAQSRRYVDQISSLKKKLETAATTIDYLRSRLSNYEDPDIGTYDHKDRMIREMERNGQ
ncbi:hypothetical protein UFOVP237_48 [uncultured Caudovirales phage]|uniref:Uncharacterized protein n=1 Tax=uncultured Caudovirales phage TaxID=2100421 RepID=A0A6J7WPS6_9CAUD|nr:hypothetical protein UFOVP237_48 [uncultured Caudovirales phage]